MLIERLGCILYNVKCSLQSGLTGLLARATGAFRVSDGHDPGQHAHTHGTEPCIA